MRRIFILLAPLLLSCSSDDDGCECRYYANLDLSFDTCATADFTENWNVIIENNPNQIEALYNEAGCER